MLTFLASKPVCDAVVIEGRPTPGIHCKMDINSNYNYYTSLGLNIQIYVICLNAVLSAALEVINVMRSINPRFTYLLTYLLTPQSPLVTLLRTLQIYDTPTQPGHPSMGKRNEYQRKLGRKQAHRARCTNPYPWSGSVNWCLAEG